MKSRLESGEESEDPKFQGRKTPFVFEGEETRPAVEEPARGQLGGKRKMAWLRRKEKTNIC